MPRVDATRSPKPPRGAWSRCTLKFALTLKILMSVGTLGIAALAPAILYDTYYVFTTPADTPNSARAAAP